MKNDEGLDFALSPKTGRMVDIRMVERGLACGCVCPNCGAELQARKGRKNRHHFAHHVAGRARPTCDGGRESALHRAARQIIAGWQSVELPALLVHEAGRQGALPGRILSVRRSELPDERGERSPWSHLRVRPDVVLHGEEEEIWCEVKVAHAVDDAKRGRLEGYWVSRLEFDLSQMHRSGGWNLATLEHVLRNDISIRQWVFHVGETQLRQRLRDEIREADAQRRKHLTESRPRGSMAADAPPENAIEEGDVGTVEMVFHPALGLIPKDPARRLAVLARAYPEPKVFHLAHAIAFLRHHPHGDRSCLVTFGSSGPRSRTSEYDAALSAFARAAGLQCVSFGIAESRLLRGEDCYELLDQFLTDVQAREGTMQSCPLMPPRNSHT
ncbi:hypothetical protein LLG90_24135 [Aromatoleum toluclasticum]|uniref:hypothetical protein n=1 Tax=Aromatoleum toluclasticum TaxID=92003 RepID=UPI001D18A90D|nr:hypothetical protein [Aromatoleum toluclasticum]MCC4118451.1 hypothetical protein [Aromatoleum toluclasticum]